MNSNNKVAISGFALLVVVVIAIYTLSKDSVVNVSQVDSNIEAVVSNKITSKMKESKPLKFTHFRVGNRNVKDILIDGKYIWIGTSGGVIRYTPGTDEHKVYDINSGLLSNGIFHLSKFGNKVVVGTYGGGLSLLDPKTEQWESFNIPDGLGDAFIYDFLQLKNGDIWIATWSGANRIRGGDLGDRSKWELFTVKNTNGGLPNDWVYGLAEGKNGEIWMATEGGLALFKNNEWHNWNHKDGLGADYKKVKKDITYKNDPSKVSSHHARQKKEMGLENVDISYNPNYIISILVDRDGIVWCGTWGGGLARFDGQHWSNLTTKDGLPANHIFMLHQDKKQRMWIGTSNGLVKYDNKEFKTYTTMDGLFSNTVFTMDSTIAANGEQSFWVGGFGGVTHFKGL